MIGRVPERRRDLQLPTADPRLRQTLEQVGQVGQGEPIDLGVRPEGDPPLAQPMHRFECALPAALDAPQPIVRAGEPVHGHAHQVDARVLHRRDALARQVAPAGGHRAPHAGLADRSNDQNEVVAKVRLPADEGDLAHAHVAQLGHEVQALVGIELPGPGGSGSRPTVDARLVARQGQLPDRVPRRRELAGLRVHDGTGVGGREGVDDGQPLANVPEAHQPYTPGMHAVSPRPPSAHVAPSAQSSSVVQAGMHTGRSTPPRSAQVVSGSSHTGASADP